MKQFVFSYSCYLGCKDLRSIADQKSALDGFDIPVIDYTLNTCSTVFSTKPQGTATIPLTLCAWTCVSM